DLGGRAFWVWNAPMPSPKIGTFDSELVADFWQAVCTQGRMNLHVLLHYGRNTHHISEAIFKGLARSLRSLAINAALVLVAFGLLGWVIYDKRDKIHDVFSRSLDGRLFVLAFAIY